MADPLSAISGVSAVVGLVDVVCRLSKNIYEFLAAVKDAPKESRQLQDQLKDLDEVVMNVQEYCREHEEADFLQGGQIALPSFLLSLTGFHTELDKLQEIIIKPNSRGFGLFRSKVKWVFNEAKIRKSMERIESHKTSLSATLSTIGRRNDLVLQQEMKTLSTNVSNQTYAIENLRLNADDGSPQEKRYFHVECVIDASFTGRETELDFIRRNLDKKSHTQNRVVIWGCGGAGKTQLASAYACTYEPSYSAVFWITARDEQSLRESFARIAEYLDLPEKQDGSEKEQSVAGQQRAINAVQSWFVGHSKGDWLLVVDNADDLEAVNLRRYLPVTKKGHVIITSRSRKAAELGADIELAKMTPEEAISLLLRKGGVDEPTEEEKSHAAKIAEQLGYLALAIDHAGSHIRSFGSLDEYMNSLDSNRKEILSSRPECSSSEYSVFETFEISYKAIEKRRPEAAKLISLFGFLDGNQISESILLGESDLHKNVLEVVGGRAGYLPAVRELSSLSLVRRTIKLGEATISIHPLVHYWSRARLDAKETRTFSIVSAHCIFANVNQGSGMLLGMQRHASEVLHCALAIKDPIIDENNELSTWNAIVLIIALLYPCWHLQGRQAELSAFCEKIMQSLDSGKFEVSVALAGMAIEIWAATVDYSENKHTLSSQQVRENFVMGLISDKGLVQLDAILQKEDWEKPLDKDSVSDMFPTVKEAERMNLQSHVVMLAMVQAGQRRWKGAYFFARYADLYDTTMFLPEGYTVLSIISAAREAVEGDIEKYVSTMLAMFRKLRDWGKIILAPILFCDFTKVLLQMGKYMEVEDLIKPLLFNPDKSEAEIAEQLGISSTYHWTIIDLYKAYHGQGKFEEAKAILEKGYETTKRVMGEGTLSHLVMAHALSQMFGETKEYLCQEEAEKFSKEKLEIFELIYRSNQSKLKRMEGLRMGLVLQRQGILPEAELVCQLFLDLAVRQLGRNDPISIKSQEVWKVVSAEVEEQRRLIGEGIVDTRFGMAVFPREIGDDGREVPSKAADRFR